MSRVPAVFLSLMFFVAFSCWASAARADPIRVTAGVVDSDFGPLGGEWNSERLELTGAGLSIVSSLEDEEAFVQLAALPALTPGALVDLSGVLHVEDVVGGQLNDSFVLVTAPFKLSFDASPTPLACSTVFSSTLCTGVAPFAFTADLTLTPLGGVPVTHHLIGGGTAVGRFQLGSFEAGAVRYTFDASPVPEPATLSLFTTGAILAGAGAWRRRRTDRRTA